VHSASQKEPNRSSLVPSSLALPPGRKLLSINESHSSLLPLLHLIRVGVQDRVTESTSRQSVRNGIGKREGLLGEGFFERRITENVLFPIDPPSPLEQKKNTREVDHARVRDRVREWRIREQYTTGKKEGGRETKKRRGGGVRFLPPPLLLLLLQLFRRQVFRKLRADH
jgi:hypothetical protein